MINHRPGILDLSSSAFF